MNGSALGFLALASLALGLFISQLASTNAWLGAENFELELANRDLRIELDALELELSVQGESCLAEVRRGLPEPEPEPSLSASGPRALAAKAGGLQ